MTKEILWRSPERELEYRTNTVKSPTDLLNHFLNEHTGEPAKIFLQDSEPIEAIILSDSANKLLAVRRSKNPDWILIAINRIMWIATARASKSRRNYLHRKTS